MGTGNEEAMETTEHAMKTQSAKRIAQSVKFIPFIPSPFDACLPVGRGEGEPTCPAYRRQAHAGVGVMKTNPQSAMHHVGCMAALDFT
jgi:hypothetical protein